MSSFDKPNHQPRLRIRDFRRGRELSALAILAGITAWVVAAGQWDLVLVSIATGAFIVANVIRRAEWNGRPIVQAMAGPSAFEDWRALPRDLFALTFIIVANVANMIVLALIIGTSPIWFIGVGLAVVISLSASIMLIREIRRRVRTG